MKSLHLIFSCVLAAQVSAPSVRAEAPFEVGVLTDLSGPSAENGLNCTSGIAVAEEAAPTRAVAFKLGDHRGEARSGLLEFKKLLEVDGVKAVIANRSQVVMPLVSLADSAKLPLLGIAGHSALLERGRFAFRFFPGVEQEGAEIAALMKRIGTKKLALLTLEDEWTVSLTQALKAALRESGITIVSDETLPSPSAAEALQASARLRTGGADAVFLNLGFGSVGVFLKRMREQGFKGRVVSNFWIAGKAEVEAAGVENAEGALFIETNVEKPRFLDRFEKAAPGKRPTALAYSCYAAAAALLQLTVASGTPLTGEALASALRGLSSVKLLDESLPMVDREVKFDLQPKVLRSGNVALWKGE